MSLSRKKVLWVDDEIEFLRSHIMFLETRGYRVTPVFSGDDAIHLISEKPDEFDIVLLDEQMPGKGGLATLAEIKEMLPDLPIVMVTKSEEEQLMEEAFGRKIDGYLTKPVNPSQILIVCKRLLHSKELVSNKLKQEFSRNYSTNREMLRERMSFSEWVVLYSNISKWDMELENIRDEGIRQAHIGQRFDANRLFSEYLVAKYMKWMQGKGNPPPLSPDVMDTFILPQLKTNEQLYVIILDCMRLDQFLILHPLLKKYFHIKTHHFFSILPSTPEFSRTSLLSGLYPTEIANQYPEVWQEILRSYFGGNIDERFLLHEKLKSKGYDPDKMLNFIKLTDENSTDNYIDSITKNDDKQMVAMVIDFFDMFIRGHATSKVLQDIAPDEIAFRKLTISWFERSRVFQILKQLANQNCTVIFTTSNGTCLCTRGTEFYGKANSLQNLRYRFGEKLTCDERYAFFMHEPNRFKLPAGTPQTCYITLKENYYFINHDVYKNYNKQYLNTFQHGGISLEEIIIPLAIMTPKQIHI